MGFWQCDISFLIIFRLSLQVALDEVVNGSTIDDLRKCGLVYLEPVQNARQKVFLRMSKPLLRIMLGGDGSELEHLLCGGSGALGSNILPDGIELKTLLRTCRAYHANTQETVQLVSWLLSLRAWLLLEKRPPPTLASLRPGAAATAAADAVVPFLQRAATYVDDEGRKAEPSARQEVRLAAVNKIVPRLIARADLDGAAVQQAAWTVESSPAVDSWASLDESGLYLLQCKGNTTATSAIRHKEAKDILSEMDKLVQVGYARYLYDCNTSIRGPNAKRSKAPPAAVPIPLTVAGYELLATKAVHHTNVADGILAKLQLGDKACIVMTAETLRTALGPTRGAIATRGPAATGNEEVRRSGSSGGASRRKGEGVGERK